MKRLAVLLLLSLAWPAFAQDEPTPPPVTPPVVTPDVPAKLEITGPTEFKFREFIELEAKGGPEGNNVRWRYVGANGPKFRYTRKLTDGSEDLRFIELPHLPGVWTLEVLVAGQKSIEDDSHTFTIQGTLPIPDPDVPTPPVLTLAQLAGDKAAPLGQMYAALKASIGKDITSIEVFKAAEASSLELTKLKGHGATDAIAKRLDVKFEELGAALDKVIAELTTAPINTATNLTYVFEKDDGEPNSSVMAGIDRVNRQTKIRAMVFEEDLPPPTDAIKAAVDAARSSGLPAIVLTAGKSVLKVVKNPTTADQVWGVAQ